jgi:hypothetical protein
MAIYFIQDSYSRAVKVGYSANVAKRFAALQVAAPYTLHLLGVVPGGEDREQEIHAALSERFRRLRGEWYEPSDDLLRMIAAMTSRKRTVGDHSRLRNNCRYGLRGLRMRHLISGLDFDCGGSMWDRHSQLVLLSRPPLLRPGVVLDDSIVIHGIDVMTSFVPYRDDEKLSADECVLIDHWPVTCCQPEIREAGE